MQILFLQKKYIQYNFFPSSFFYLQQLYPSSNALRFISIDFGGRLSFIVVITSSLSNGNDDIAVDAPTIAIFIDNGCPAFNAILLASKLYTSATFESSSDKISSIFG